MKKFKLYNNTDISSKELLVQVLQRPSNPQTGLTISDIRKATKIIDKIEAATDFVILEEVEYSYVKNAFNSFPFGVAHKDIVTIADSIEEATDHEV